jgi:hypothetical protein
MAPAERRTVRSSSEAGINTTVELEMWRERFRCVRLFMIWTITEAAAPMIAATIAAMAGVEFIGKTCGRNHVTRNRWRTFGAT